MNLEQLSDILKDSTSFDIHSAFHDFHQETGIEDLAHFISYLRQSDLIDSRLFCEIYSQEQVGLATLTNFVRSYGEEEDNEDEDEDEEKHSAEQADTVSNRQHYEILGLLGKGAMGEVHLAKDMC